MSNVEDRVSAAQAHGAAEATQTAIAAESALDASAETDDY